MISVLMGILIFTLGMIIGAVLFHNYQTSIAAQAKVNLVILELEKLLTRESNMLNGNDTIKKLMDFTKTAMPRLKDLI